MRHITIPCLMLVALLSACSSPDSRIESNRAAFDQYPADVQTKIRAGKVDVGFTPEMVKLALGEPSRQVTRKTEGGEAIVWMYADNKPQISFGIGLGSSGRNSGMGVCMSTSTGGYQDDEKIRVEFQAGLVVSVEYRKN